MKEDMFDRIDALGSQPERHLAFTQAMLAEIEDDELAIIVKDAARDLDTPIALVNLILEEIQFFKAHFGLPDDLRALRATNRDVSFCQFVVKDGKLFEVNDAKSDPRVPQELVNDYGIRSYLGIPIYVNDIVVGSLCVIDFKPRKFTDEDRASLTKLSKLVNKRLARLAQTKRSAYSSLLAQSTAPALKEMQNSLVPITAETSHLTVALAEIKAFIRKAEYVLADLPTFSTSLGDTLKLTHNVLKSCENSLYNIEMSAADLEDMLSALGQAFSQSSLGTLEDIAVSGRELARGNSRLIGGVYLPDIEENPIILTPRPLAVSLVANGISMMAAKMIDLNIKQRIIMDVVLQREKAGISLEVNALDDEMLQDIAARLNRYLGKDPTIDIQIKACKILLLFAIDSNDIDAT